MMMMMIHQPDWITFAEGLSVQALHVGSYDDEAPVIARMHKEFLPSQGLVPRGKHHEIYLGDPRKVEAAKLSGKLGSMPSPW